MEFLVKKNNIVVAKVDERGIEKYFEGGYDFEEIFDGEGAEEVIYSDEVDADFYGLGGENL